MPVMEGIVKSRLSCEIPNCSVQEYIWKTVEKWPQKTAVICGQTGRNYTFQELRQRSMMVANFLTSKYNKSQCICLAIKNLPEYPILLLGALQAGLIVTACNPNSTKEEFKFQLQDSAAKVVITSPEVLTRLNQAIEDDPMPPDLISIDNDGNLDIPRDTREPTSIIVDPTDLAFILYSSGTTGLPKGVELTHHNVVSLMHALWWQESNQKTTGDVQDVIPGFVPFYHTLGMLRLCLVNIALGAKIVTISKFTSEIFVDVLRKHKSVVLFCVPYVVHMILENSRITTEDLSSLRQVRCGACPLSAADIERLESKVGKADVFVQGYGLTEACATVLIQSHRLENGFKIGGVGLLVPNMEAKIVPIDDDTSLLGLGPYQKGELMFRGPTVMKGYHNDAKATAGVLTDDGWLRTGDVAYYDEHEHFFIVDRIKDTIKVKGFQVSPAELEGILRTHPKVEDAGIVGVPHASLGEAPKAFVVVRQRTSASELAEFVSTRVSPHKRLAGGVEFVAAIPKNAVGKILRKELRTYGKPSSSVIP